MGPVETLYQVMMISYEAVVPTVSLHAVSLSLIHI